MVVKRIYDIGPGCFESYLSIVNIKQQQQQLQQQQQQHHQQQQQQQKNKNLTK
jgi:hypothetical protein